MEMFVTDTMIIDVRDGSFIMPGDPVPQAAMNPGTLQSLLATGGMLPYSEHNAMLKNPRKIRRAEALSLAGLSGMAQSQRVEPRSLAEADRMAADPNYTQPSVPAPQPAKTAVTAPRAISDCIWDFDPTALRRLDIQVIQGMMSEKCAVYDIPLLEITDKEKLIAHMSQHYRPPVLEAVEMEAPVASVPKSLIQHEVATPKTAQSGPKQLVVVQDETASPSAPLETLSTLQDHIGAAVIE